MVLACDGLLESEDAGLKMSTIQGLRPHQNKAQRIKLIKCFCHPVTDIKSESKLKNTILLREVGLGFMPVGNQTQSAVGSAHWVWWQKLPTPQILEDMRLQVITALGEILSHTPDFPLDLHHQWEMGPQRTSHMLSSDCRTGMLLFCTCCWILNIQPSVAGSKQTGPSQETEISAFYIWCNWAFLKRAHSLVDLSLFPFISM